SGHLLGTDPLGRDMLSVLMRALLTSFAVAAAGAGIAVVVGATVGYVAAEWDAVPGAALLLGGTAVYTLPAVVLWGLFPGIGGPGTPVPMLAIGLFAAPAFARVTCGAMQAIDGFGYVQAAALAGLGRIEVFRRHTGPALALVLSVPLLEQLGIGILAE